MRLDMCPHGVVDGCEECRRKRAVFNDKSAVLRAELADLQRMLTQMHEVLQIRNEALMNERDKLQARIAEYDLEVATLRARVALLEKVHKDNATTFASGRRYERAWGDLRSTALEPLIVELKQQLKLQEDLVVDLQTQLEAERDRRIEAERRSHGPLEEEG